MLVVACDSCPSHKAMTAASMPASRKRIAAVWRRVCTVTCLLARSGQMDVALTRCRESLRWTASAESAKPCGFGKRAWPGRVDRSWEYTLSRDAVVDGWRPRSGVKVPDVGSARLHL